jgi:hypothetical protein
MLSSNLRIMYPYERLRWIDFKRDGDVIVLLPS